MLSPNKSCSKDNLDGVIDVQQYNPLIHQQLGESKIQAANSLRSKRFRTCSSRKLGQEQNKKNDGGAGGERRKRLPTNPMILKNCVRPRVQLLIGVVWVVLITNSTWNINKTRYALFTCVADLVSSEFCGRTYYRWFGQLIFIWIVFVQRFMRSESSKYKWRSSSGDWEGQFIENDGVQIWLEKMEFAGDNINLNQNISTWH